jgi:hypothetical protein
VGVETTEDSNCDYRAVVLSFSLTGKSLHPQPEPTACASACVVSLIPNVGALSRSAHPFTEARGVLRWNAPTAEGKERVEEHAFEDVPNQ